MIKIDYSNSNVTKNTITRFKYKVNKIHNDIVNRTGAGNEMLGWFEQPHNYSKKEFNEIIKKVKELKDNKIETLLVIGIGGSYLGAKAAIDFIKGTVKTRDEIIFAGINMSDAYIKQIEEKLKNKKWAICVISKSGTTLEPAIAFRHFRNLLEKKYKQNTSEYILVVTDKDKSALKELSASNKYKTFIIPSDIGGRFSAFTPAGLIPMAFAGIDIKKIMEGATKCKEDFKDPSLETNIPYQYAVIRYYLSLGRIKFIPKPIPWMSLTFKTKKSYFTEIFADYDPDLNMLGEWWKQLFAESEGKDNKGLFVASVSYSRDLHSVGQLIQEGKKTFFETVLWIENDQHQLNIKADKNNLDGLNYLTTRTLHEINEQAFKGVVDAHWNNGKVPNIIINLSEKSEFSLGYLFYFYFLSVTMSGYLLKINPFDQPGVEIYKKRMFTNLKK